MKDTKEMFKKMYPCYFSFFVTGMMVLMVGAVLPYLIEDAGINYSIAGGFLSTFAIGNLLAALSIHHVLKGWEDGERYWYLQALSQ